MSDLLVLTCSDLWLLASSFWALRSRSRFWNSRNVQATQRCPSDVVFPELVICERCLKTAPFNFKVDDSKRYENALTFEQALVIHLYIMQRRTGRKRTLSVCMIHPATSPKREPAVVSHAAVPAAPNITGTFSIKKHPVMLVPVSCTDKLGIVRQTCQQASLGNLEAKLIGPRHGGSKF